jgi:hypothetical protein
MAVFVSADGAEDAREALFDADLSPVLIGEVIPAEGQRVITRGRLKL